MLTGILDPLYDDGRRFEMVGLDSVSKDEETRTKERVRTKKRARVKKKARPENWYPVR